jgi:hypothetical protein
MKGNYIFTVPGQKAFLVSSNYVNYVELGIKDANDYYIEAKIENGKFTVNGRLYDATGNLLCKLKHNQLEEMHSKCKMILGPRGEGYKIETGEGQMIIELFLKDPNTCILRGDFYDKNGNLVAKGTREDLLILRGPAILGKSNGSLGIVLR